MRVRAIYKGFDFFLCNYYREISVTFVLMDVNLLQITIVFEDCADIRVTKLIGKLINNKDKDALGYLNIKYLCFFHLTE